MRGVAGIVTYTSAPLHGAQSGLKLSAAIYSDALVAAIKKSYMYTI